VEIATNEPPPTTHIVAPPTFLHTSNIINHVQKLDQLVAFSHAAMFAPSLTALTKAIQKDFLVGFPGLTVDNLRMYPPTATETAKGHLDQNQQNKQSTPKASLQLPLLPTGPPLPIHQPNALLDHDPDYHPHQEEPTHYCFASVYALPPQGQRFSDQTGRFPTTSSQGNTQLFILYNFDSYSIHAVPIPTKSGPDILAAYTTVVNTLVHAGLCPKLHRLDSECSAILKDFMAKQQITHQLVPPGVHRANTAERAIRTFKNHFIAGLCTTDPKFPSTSRTASYPRHSLH
jgi:hypothetical protein